VTNLPAPINHQNTILPDPSAPIFTNSGLILPEDITFEDWAAIGQKLQWINKAIHWWIGDWIRFGERKWGEVYTQALEDTPFAYQTLANDVWVASAIESSRRKENLTFSHHAVVAALPPAEQDSWLAKAEAEGWSSRKLWEETRVDPPPAILYSGPAIFSRQPNRWALLLPEGVELKAKDGAQSNIIVKEAPDAQS
jgi:hypothetical protein